jgi:hypothetical protein
LIGSFYASIRAWAPNDFQVMGTAGIIGFRGPIVRPYALCVSPKAPLRLKEPTFGWREPIRQRGLVHLVAQLAGLSGRSRGKLLN